jgi:hypothetical protein
VPSDERRARRSQVRETKRRMAEFRRQEQGHRRLRSVLRVGRWVALGVLVLAAGTWLLNPGLAGESARDRVHGLVSHEPEGTYEFLLVARSGGAVGWDPCVPISYVVNPAGAPADWEAITEHAVSEISEASGFDFTYDGTSASRPRDDSIRGAALLIAWADPEEFPDLAGPAAGVAYTNPIIKGTRSYLADGAIALDEKAYARMATDGETRASELILEHQLGHVLGLADVEDTGELMNTEYVGQDGFGPGDLVGLSKVHDVPCS